MFGSLMQLKEAATVIDANIKIRMNPLQMRKAGAIVQNCQGAGYSEVDINHICRALFLDQSEDDMKPAFEMFDEEGKGSISSTAFKEVLALMGEDVPPEEIERIFVEADTDGSGLLEMNEFIVMVRQMNPTQEEPESEGMFGILKMPTLPTMPNIPMVPSKDPTEPPSAEVLAAEEGSSAMEEAAGEAGEEGEAEQPGDAEVASASMEQLEELEQKEALLLMKDLNAELVDAQKRLLNTSRNERHLIKAEIDGLDTKIEAAHSGITDIQAKTAAKTRHAGAARNELAMPEEAAINEVALAPMRRQWGDKMFDIYDTDKSGCLSLKEFVFLMRSQDPDLTEAEVQASMGGDSTGGQMNRVQFYTWLDSVFGTLEDDEFEETMEVMTEMDGLGLLTPARKAWADRLFDRFDEDGSGTMSLNEFVKLMQCVAPEVTRTEVEGTMLSAGVTDGIMERQNFYQWINDVFGAFDDHDFEMSLSSMIKAK